MTANTRPRLPPGSTYFNRQYVTVGPYDESDNTASKWVPQVRQSMIQSKTWNTGRPVYLIASDVGTVDAAYCATLEWARVEAALSSAATGTMYCNGSTTPQTGTRPYFAVQCASSTGSASVNYLGPDPYALTASTATDKKPYECLNDNTLRPSWTLVGHFTSTACASSEMASARLDKGLALCRSPTITTSSIIKLLFNREITIMSTQQQSVFVEQVRDGVAKALRIPLANVVDASIVTGSLVVSFRLLSDDPSNTAEQLASKLQEAKQNGSLDAALVEAGAGSTLGWVIVGDNGSNEDDDNGGRMSAGKIAGIVIGVLLATGCMVVGTVFAVRYRRQAHRDSIKAIDVLGADSNGSLAERNVAAAKDRTPSVESQSANSAENGNVRTGDNDDGDGVELVVVDKHADEK